MLTVCADTEVFIRCSRLRFPYYIRSVAWFSTRSKYDPASSPSFFHQKIAAPPKGCGVGWVGEVRTHECGSQSPVPYHLATTHYTAARGGAFVKKKRPRRNGPERSLVGCLERFELSASRATIWRANQLRHRHHIMRPKGLEPPAHCLEGSCSIQLSYGRLLRVHVREGHTA